MRARLGFVMGTSSFGAGLCFADGRYFTAGMCAWAAMACLALLLWQRWTANG